MVFKLGFSIILQFLLVEVSKGNKETAYFYSLFGGFTYYCSQMSRHNAIYRTPILSARVKAALI
jgi:hypothetical protein